MWTNCPFFYNGMKWRLGRIDAWDELRLGTNWRLGQIVVFWKWDKLSLETLTLSVLEVARISIFESKRAMKHWRHLRQQSICLTLHFLENQDEPSWELYQTLRSNISRFSSFDIFWKQNSFIKLRDTEYPGLNDPLTIILAAMARLCQILTTYWRPPNTLKSCSFPILKQ